MFKASEFTGYDAKDKCQWRLKSTRIFNKISIVFDNALVTKLYILRVSLYQFLP